MNSELKTHESLLKQLYDINEFRKLFPQRFSDAPAPFHREMNDMLCKDPSRVAYAAPRGFGKTTGVTFLQILWRIAYRKEKFIVILTNRSELSKTFLSQIREQLEHNKDYITVYELELVKSTEQELRIKYIDNSYCTIKCLGGGQDPRGLTSPIDGYRPTLEILDEYEGEKARESLLVRDKLFGNFVHAILPGLDPKCGKLWILGTIVHEDTILNQKIKLVKEKKDGWVGNIYQAIENGKSLWEERFPLKGLLEDREQHAGQGTKSLSAWYCEYMNQPVSDHTRSFKDKDIRYFDRQTVINNLNKYLVLTTVDYAQTKKRTSDYTVVTTVAIDYKTGYWYILEMNYLKRNQVEEINAVLKAYLDYRPVRIGMEEAGAGISFIENCEAEALRRGISFNVEKLHPMKTDYAQKNQRIVNYLQPKFHNGMVHIPEKLPDWYDLFKREYSEFVEDKDNSHDDGLDTLAYITFMEKKFGVGARYHEVPSNYVSNYDSIDTTYVF